MSKKEGMNYVMKRNLNYPQHRCLCEISFLFKHLIIIFFSIMVWELEKHGSAITVCEEMRKFLKEMAISKRVIIVASPNVQENFKLQLFDERKLKNIDGLWNIPCMYWQLFYTGNKSNVYERI